jgi:hypothetical protein
MYTSHPPNAIGTQVVVAPDFGQIKEPKWIDRPALAILHEESLAMHGGQAGVPDEGLLEAALAGPRQLWNYEAEPGLARLAAASATYPPPETSITVGAANL